MNHIYSEIICRLEKQQPVALKTALKAAEGTIAGGMDRRLTEAVPASSIKGRRCASVVLEEKAGAFCVTEPMLPQERLIVLGAGHIALPVCEFGAKSGFSVIVCDDRPDFANHQRFPDAAQVLCDSFENAIRRVQITPYDYVVIITRGHRHDADCLRAILPGSEPAYLGMIGSRRRVKGLLEMLREEGFEPEKIAKIRSPIGLNIGAVTPAEIAVSILSEVISYKRLPEYGDPDRFCSDSDVELSILQYLAEDRTPKAIATVIETRGSTPRGTGAKMAVSPLGKVTGSIGGGCSEAAVIQDAIRIIGTGRYKILEIDLTGEVAESDGMVCGGTMKVLLEDGTETCGNAE